MKTVQHPRGTTEQEDGIVGAEGQLRIDVTRGEVRVHDGQRQGGHRLPNIDTVRQLIASGGDSSTVGIEVVNTVGDLAALTPTANKLALLNLAGSEDMFVWQAGAAPDAGAITSTVEGHWQRLDGRMGFWVRLYRAGVVNMQINGAEPAANKDTTVWIDNGTVKLYDGSAYLAATPTLTARLLAQVGNYAVGSVALPNRLADIATNIADLDTITESGWYRSTAGAANAPVAGVHVIEHKQIDSDDAIQWFYLHNNSGRNYYVRYAIAGVWGAWQLIEPVLPSRLSSTAGTVTDANSANESGFFKAASTAANLPVAEDGTIIAIKYSSTAMTQIWESATANKAYLRRMTAGAWQAWKAIYPATLDDATGTVTRGSVGISTISQAEAEAGVATTDRIFTAERIAQAITNLIGGALRTIRALTLEAGDMLYATGAGVIARLPKGTEGQKLTMVGGVPTWLGGAALNHQVFLADGTWTKPSEGTMALVRLWGGGASGTKANNTATSYQGYGGGGGAYYEFLVPLDVLGATEAVVVGLGGASRTGSGAQTGLPGGTSSFWLASAQGGQGAEASGGVVASGGSGSGALLAANSTGGASSQSTGTNQNTKWGGAGGGTAGRGGAGPHGPPGICASGYSGDGGMYATGSAAATAGEFPAGGGGGSINGPSGKGGDGKVEIYVF